MSGNPPLSPLVRGTTSASLPYQGGQHPPASLIKGDNIRQPPLGNGTEPKSPSIPLSKGDNIRQPPLGNGTEPESPSIPLSKGDKNQPPLVRGTKTSPLSKGERNKSPPYQGGEGGSIQGRDITLALAIPAGVALAAAFLVHHGCLAALGAQVADLEHELVGGRIRFRLHAMVREDRGSRWYPRSAPGTRPGPGRRHPAGSARGWGRSRASVRRRCRPTGGRLPAGGRVVRPGRPGAGCSEIRRPMASETAAVSEPALAVLMKTSKGWSAAVLVDGDEGLAQRRLDG